MAATLEGSTALVTGATAGIGRAIALQLAALGAEVVVHGRGAQRGAETVREIQNVGGKARFVAADLSDPDDTRRLVAEAGLVDILINNAGANSSTAALVAATATNAVGSRNSIGPAYGCHLHRVCRAGLIRGGRGVLLHAATRLPTEGCHPWIYPRAPTT